MSLSIPYGELEQRYEDAKEAIQRVRDLAEYWQEEGFRNYRRHQDAGRRDASHYWLFMYQAGRDILNALDGEQE